MSTLWLQTGRERKRRSE